MNIVFDKAMFGSRENIFNWLTIVWTLDITVNNKTTIVPTKSDSEVMFCIQLLSKQLLVQSTWANANQ